VSAFAATKGVFATQSDVALQSINGFGFRPVAVIAWWSRQGSHGVEAGNRGGIGFWTRDASAAVAWRSADGARSSETGSLADCAAILGVEGVDEAVSMRADVASFDADGITLRWRDRPSEPWLVHFLALGGALVRARVGSVSSSPSNGSKDVEGAGTGVDLLLLMPAPAETGLRAEGLDIGIGAASGKRQAAAGYASPNDALPGRVTGAQRSDCAAIVLNGPGNPPTIGAVRRHRGHDLAVEWSGSSRPTQRLCYLALEGLRVKVGIDISPATPGTRRTRLGFRPEALLLFSWGLAGSATPKQIGRLCVGGATERESGCVSWDDRNIEAQETMTHVASSIAHALEIADTQTGGVHAQAALDSVDERGFTLDWTESDGKLRQFVYVAMSGGKSGSWLSNALGRKSRREPRRLTTRSRPALSRISLWVRRPP